MSTAPPSTAILSHRLWMSRYGGDPEVIGTTIRLNDRRSVLIGVMPEGFEFSPFDCDLGAAGSAVRRLGTRTRRANPPRRSGGWPTACPSRRRGRTSTS